MVVNPPSPDDQVKLIASGGPARACEWVLGGLIEPTVYEVPLTATEFLNSLLAKGLSEALAQKLVDTAVSAGEVPAESSRTVIDAAAKDRAETEAVTVALGLRESRRRTSDLSLLASNASLKELYGQRYPTAIARAGVEAVEFTDGLPVLTGQFGFSRGDSTPGMTRLVPFRVARSYAIYGDISKTEALYVRLRPSRVATWLRMQGFRLDDWADEKAARVAILNAMVRSQPEVPEALATSVTGALTLLVHSFAHRFIRRVAVFAGADRTALSELLIPAHCGFFVYAATRGEFVLGGLQAVFEGELDRFLVDLVDGEHRCPLDPGCRRAGGACVACLHLGESSCRLFNTDLNRAALTGSKGYFDLH